jgi:hypothetical protein
MLPVRVSAFYYRDCLDIPLRHAAVRNTRGLPRDVRDKIVRGVEWRVRPLTLQPLYPFIPKQVPMGRSKTTVLQLAGYYMYIVPIPRCIFVTLPCWYSGELPQAQRVLALCGKGRGSATASETCAAAAACFDHCENVTLCSCELLHVACRDERLGADAVRMCLAAGADVRCLFRPPMFLCNNRSGARPVRRCAVVELQARERGDSTSSAAR